MATTTAFKTKKYLADSFEQLAIDYNWAISVTYGPFPGDKMQASYIEVGDINIQSTTPYSSGSNRRVMYEEYLIECSAVVATGGTCLQTETQLYDVYSIIEDFVRDDLMNSKLGGNVNDAICSPGSIQSGASPSGGTIAVILFNVECKAKVR